MNEISDDLIRGIYYKHRIVEAGSTTICYLEFARELLALASAPAATQGEAVAWRMREETYCGGWEFGWTYSDDAKCHETGEKWEPLYTTPQPTAPARAAEYTPAIGEAAQAYCRGFRHMHPLPGHWSWKELWDAMAGAAVRAEQRCKKCDGAGYVYSGPVGDPPTECEACIVDGPPDEAPAGVEAAQQGQEPVVNNKFQRAWVQLSELPGTMMVGPDGLFGPIPGSTSAWITTSERERDHCLAKGKPMLEVWAAQKSHPQEGRMP